MGFIWYIIIGIIAGFLAGKIMRGGGFGLIINLLLGFLAGKITQSPFIGFGPFLSNIFGDELLSSPNGLTDLMRYYGIPLSIVFYYLLYRGTKVYVGNSHKGANVCVFVSLLLLCFSQTITYSPFFMVLYFFAFNTCTYDK